MVHAEMTSLYRTDQRFVPFYTKSFLSSVMDTYYDQISLYKASCIIHLLASKPRASMSKITLE